MMRFGLLLITILGLTIVTVTTALAPQVAGAGGVIPKAGVVEVTGFNRICCNGQSGPVVVVAKGRGAAALRAALSGLVPTLTGTFVCMETVEPFIVSLVPRIGGHPTLVAAATSCGGQFVSVKVGQSVAKFKDDCVLQRAVAAALPLGRAEGTRQAVSAACPVSRKT